MRKEIFLAGGSMGIGLGLCHSLGVRIKAGLTTPPFARPLGHPSSLRQEGKLLLGQPSFNIQYSLFNIRYSTEFPSLGRLGTPPCCARTGNFCWVSHHSTFNIPCSIFDIQRSFPHPSLGRLGTPPRCARRGNFCASCHHSKFLVQYSIFNSVPLYFVCSSVPYSSVLLFTSALPPLHDHHIHP
jgi:hypothetical protein